MGSSFHSPYFTITMLLASIMLGVESQTTSKSRTLELIGNATLGFYCVNVYLGSKMQRECLIIDTGSSTTIVPCEGCKNYGPYHYNHWFLTKSNDFLTSKIDNIPHAGWKCPNLNSEGECRFDKVVISNAGIR